MQVLAAVIKAGASREHEILAEIRDAVFSFIRKMEPKRVMDTMLVSRVRILYIRSLLARSPELQSIKVNIYMYMLSLVPIFGIEVCKSSLIFRFLQLSDFWRRLILDGAEVPVGAAAPEDLLFVMIQA